MIDKFFLKTTQPLQQGFGGIEPTGQMSVVSAKGGSAYG